MVGSPDPQASDKMALKFHDLPPGQVFILALGFTGA
jgi:hypothetical protein